MLRKLNLHLKTWLRTTCKSRKKRISEVVFVLRNRFCKYMKRNQWSSLLRMIQCSIKLLYIFKELLKLWKHRLKLLIVFRGKLLIWLRRMSHRKMNLKLLIREKGLILCSNKGNKTRSNDKGVMNRIVTQVRMRNLKRKKSSLQISFILKEIIINHQMTMKKRRKISVLRNLDRILEEWLKQMDLTQKNLQLKVLNQQLLKLIQKLILDRMETLSIDIGFLLTITKWILILNYQMIQTVVNLQNKKLV